MNGQVQKSLFSVRVVEVRVVGLLNNVNKYSNYEISQITSENESSGTAVNTLSASLVSEILIDNHA
jgi:hypothetical protein